MGTEVIEQSRPVRGSFLRWFSVRGAFIAVSVIAVLYLVVIPLVSLVISSLSPVDYLGTRGPWTLQGYIDLFSNPRTLVVLWNSIVFAVGSTVVSVIFGGFFAWLVQRSDIAGKRWLTILVLFPLFIPSVLMVISWQLLLDPGNGLINEMFRGIVGPDATLFNINTMAGMIWVRGVIDIPFVFLWLAPALAATDPSLEESAAMSGSSPWRILRTVTLPLLRPALFATFLISFVLSIEDVSVPIFIGLPARVPVFSTDIYLAVTSVPSDMLRASVHAMALMAITVILAIWYRRLTSKSERYAVIRGKGYRPYTIKLGRGRIPLTIITFATLFVTIGFPMFALVWTSLSKYLQVPSIEGLSNLTFDWYTTLMSNPMAMRGIFNSTVLGVTSGVAIILLALIIGWVIIRSRYRGRAALDFVAFLPLAIPGIALAVSLMWLYLLIPLPIYGTLMILFIAYVSKHIAYGVRQATTGFTQLHPELEEAAAMSGSSWARTMRTISVPLLAPMIVVGFAYVFIRGFVELSASLLLFSYGNEPYSVVTYNLYSSGSVQLTAAYGIVVIIGLTVLILIIQKVTKRNLFFN